MSLDKFLPGFLKPAFWGVFDGVVDGHAVGWARDTANPSPASIRVCIDGQWTVPAVADVYRLDLASRKIGDGRHGFRVCLPFEAFDNREHTVWVTCGDGEVELAPRKRMVLEPQIVGCLDSIEQSGLRGWACHRFESAKLVIALCMDGEVLGEATAYKFRKDLQESGYADGRCAFGLPLPAKAFDGAKHVFTARALPFGIELRGSPLTFQSRYEGTLERLANGVLYGWVWDISRPTTRVSLDIYVNGKLIETVLADKLRNDLREHSIGDGVHGFAMPLEDHLGSKESLTIEAKISGTAFVLNNSPLATICLPGVLGKIQQIARALNRAARAQSATGKNDLQPADIRSSFAEFENADLPFLRQVVLPGLQQQIARNYEMYASLPLKVSDWRRENLMAVRNIGSEPVDVIVPVYRGTQETIECLNSVFGSGSTCGYELIVVLDDPENREMKEALVALQLRHPFTLIVNRENVGFVQSVNAGMRQHPDRDVVLLNSDTVVSYDWLDRLRRAAYLEPVIGTVTPFSNNATICSYPETFQNNALPGDATAADLDTLCHAVNEGKIVDLPTAVGFCMYIRRDCLDEVGLFDAQTYGKGYAEENDFSMRAAQLGWRNVLTGDTFVKHVGSVSFGPQNGALSANQNLLLSRYPYYNDIVHAFVREDPIRKLRRNVDILRLSRATDEMVCFLTHSLGGGLTRHLGELCDGVRKQGWAPLVLRSEDGRNVTLHADVSSLPNLVYDIRTEFQELVNDLRRLDIRHIHIHSVIGMPSELLGLPAELALEYDCTIHDYSWFCPRANLVNETNHYCGEPQVSVCEKCVQLNGPHEAWVNFPLVPNAVQQLRELSLNCLSGARKVFCPSQDTRDRMHAQFHLDNLEVRPHISVLACPPGFPRAVGSPPGRVRVGLIGALSMIKGFEIVKSCALHAFKNSLPLDFVVIGHTCNDAALLELPNVSITGRYEEEAVWDLLRESELDLALFPTVWPETFSYTLSLAFACRIFPVAFDLGAIAERIRRAGFGRLLPHTADPDEINAALLSTALALDIPPAIQLEDTVYLNTIKDYYGLTAKRFQVAASSSL
jgi:GT2 family glycosyltransferase